jgi:hypothetical protein
LSCTLFPSALSPILRTCEIEIRQPNLVQIDWRSRTQIARSILISNVEICVVRSFRVFTSACGILPFRRALPPWTPPEGLISFGAMRTTFLRFFPSEGANDVTDMATWFIRVSQVRLISIGAYSWLTFGRSFIRRDAIFFGRIGDSTRWPGKRDFCTIVKVHGGTIFGNVHRRRERSKVRAYFYLSRTFPFRWRFIS